MRIVKSKIEVSHEFFDSLVMQQLNSNLTLLSAQVLLDGKVTQIEYIPIGDYWYTSINDCCYQLSF